VSVDAVISQINRFDPRAAAGVSARARKEAALPEAVDRLMGLYKDVIREFLAAGADPACDQIAAARHLRRYAPVLKGFMQQASERDAASTQLQADLGDSRLRESHERVQADHWREKWQSIHDSATWRITQSVLRSAPARLFAPLVERLGNALRTRPREP
jgi:hypothetical protein